jgi:hypothetical protein
MGVTYSTGNASTYIPIATYTVSGSSAPTVSFSNISSAYTDLRLVMSVQQTPSAARNIWLQFNTDTSSSGTNYSWTVLSGNGISPVSARVSNSASIYCDYYGSPVSPNFGVTTVDIFNYANTTTYKTTLTRNNDAASGTDAIVGLWRATPQAINKINLQYGGTGYNFSVGSTFNLYGIKAAG